MRNNYKTRILICSLSLFVFCIWTIQSFYGIYTGLEAQLGLFIVIPLIFGLMGIFLAYCAILELRKTLKLGQELNNQIPLEKYDNELIRNYINVKGSELKMKEKGEFHE